jgi:deoxyxylulose-5-phosphate synthase
VTQKGKGYAFSERNPESFHGVAPFSIDTGNIESALKKATPACSVKRWSRLRKRTRFSSP